MADNLKLFKNSYKDTKDNSDNICKISDTYRFFSPQINTKLASKYL